MIILLRTLFVALLPLMGTTPSLADDSAAQLLAPTPNEIFQPGVFNEGALQEMLDRDTNIVDINSFWQTLLSPKEHPDYGQSHTFVSMSQSRQGATPLFPRIIAYGNYTAHSLWTRDNLTFGSKSHPDIPNLVGDTSDDVEALDFDEGTRQFYFYLITFPNATQGDPGPRYDISERNPGMCMGCHFGQSTADTGFAKDQYASPRPNWISRYADWTRDQFDVYGNSSDHGGTDVPASWISLIENPGDPRLAIFPLPFSNYGPASHYYPTPNMTINLDTKIDSMNTQRVARLMQGTPDFASYKYAIYGAVKGCANIDQFIPKNLRRNFGKKNPGYYYDDTKRIHSRQGDITSEVQYQEISGIRYLFEGRQIDIRNWWTDFTGPDQNGAIHYPERSWDDDNVYRSRGLMSYAFETDFLDNQPNDDLLNYMPTPDQIRADINEAPSGPSHPENPFTCDKLKARSLQILSGGT